LTRQRARVPGLALSVVVPLYNEEESVGPLYGQIRTAADELLEPYEIVFVDDGSGDGTFEELRAIQRTDSRVTVIRFRKNYGQTAAMAAGFARARGRVIVSMDGDLQNDPADIPRLLAKIEEGYDVVCGWRKNRRDTQLSRRLPSALANWLLRRMTGVRIHDTGCTLRAYRGEVIKRVALYADLHRFIPAMSLLTGARVTELVVTHHPRRYGQSKYGISRTVKVALDLIGVRMLIGFASRPAAGFGLLSLPAVVLGMAALAGMLLTSAWGVVLAAVAFLSFAAAGHLILLGVLSEMVLQTGESPPERMFVRGTIRDGQKGWGVS
jgi:Glycosyl transferase family 2